MCVFVHEFQTVLRCKALLNVVHDMKRVPYINMVLFYYNAFGQFKKHIDRDGYGQENN